jgi:hypothetical protein
MTLPQTLPLFGEDGHRPETKEPRPLYCRCGASLYEPGRSWDLGVADPGRDWCRACGLDVHPDAARREHAIANRMAGELEPQAHSQRFLARCPRCAREYPRPRPDRMTCLACELREPVGAHGGDLAYGLAYVGPRTWAVRGRGETVRSFRGVAAGQAAMRWSLNAEAVGPEEADRRAA